MCLRAAANLVSKGVPVKLVLVGDELHGGLGGTEGYKRDMPALTSAKTAYFSETAFDTTVLSSRFEGTPNVVLESMACLPAVVTDVSDNARLVVDGRTGYVVALDDVAGLVDCLERLWIEPALRAQLGKQARAWVQAEFSTERLARLTEAVYLEALEARGYGCA